MAAARAGQMESVRDDLGDVTGKWLCRHGAALHVPFRATDDSSRNYHSKACTTIRNAQQRMQPARPAESNPYSGVACYEAERVDLNHCLKQAHRTEPPCPGMPIVPLGGCTTSKARGSMFAPPSKDWQLFADIPSNYCAAREAARWRTRAKSIGGTARTGRGDPRSVESHMTLRPRHTFSRAARLHRKKERLSREQILRQQILDECAHFDGAKEQRRICKSDLIAALHNLGLGLSFEALEQLAERETSDNQAGFIDLDHFKHTLLGSNRHLLHMLHKKKHAEEARGKSGLGDDGDGDGDGDEYTRSCSYGAGTMYSADSRQMYGIKIFSDSLPHELRARGREEPLWTPKQKVETVMQEIEADRHKVQAALAQDDSADDVLSTPAQSAGDGFLDESRHMHEHEHEHEQEREEHHNDNDNDNGNKDKVRFQEQGKACTVGKLKNVSFAHDE